MKATNENPFSDSNGQFSVDPAGVFGAAVSISDACRAAVKADPKIDLSGPYNGNDQFMREAMRIAYAWELWACTHVDFEALSDVWPYFIEEKFGDALLASIGIENLSGIDDLAFPVIAQKLGLTLVS